MPPVERVEQTFRVTGLQLQQLGPEPLVSMQLTREDTALILRAAQLSLKQAEVESLQITIGSKIKIVVSKLE